MNLRTVNLRNGAVVLTLPFRSLPDVRAARNCAGADAYSGVGLLFLPHVLHDGRRGDQGVRSLRYPGRNAVHGTARDQEAVQGAFPNLSSGQGQLSVDRAPPC